MKTKLLCCLIAVLAFGCGGNDDETAPLEQKTSRRRPRAQVASTDSNATTNTNNTNTTTNINPQAVEVYKWEDLGEPVANASMHISGDGNHIYLNSDKELFHRGYNSANEAWDAWEKVTLNAKIKSDVAELADFREKSENLKARDVIKKIMPAKSGVVVLTAKEGAGEQYSKMFVVVGNKAKWGISAAKHNKKMNSLNSLISFEEYFISTPLLKKNGENEVIYFDIHEAKASKVEAVKHTFSPTKTPKKVAATGNVLHFYQNVNEGWDVPLVLANAGEAIQAVDADQYSAFAAAGLATYAASNLEMLSNRDALPFANTDAIKSAFGTADAAFIYVPTKGVYYRMKKNDVPRP